jgi:membrane associated rhomboid family serine protease
MIPPVTKAMKLLIGSMLVIWIVAQIIGEKFFHLPIIEIFALTPGSALQHGFIWQFVTYIFLHSFEVSHILLNLLMTWFLGAELERHWGSKTFILYYLGCGILAGIIYSVLILLWHLFFGGSMGLITPVVGASGSVFGLMVAYGILFGERTIHFMLLFPMKAKVFVLILTGVEFLSLLTHGVAGSGVANLAHLGGIFSGFIILSVMTRLKKKIKSTRTSNKSGLRLVVDNEKDSDHKTRYWN